MSKNKLTRRTCLKAFGSAGAGTVALGDSGSGRTMGDDRPRTDRLRSTQTDESGVSIVWDNTYGGDGADHARSPVQTDDDGYLFTGRTRSFGSGGWDSWLVKTDSDGRKQWRETYGGSRKEWTDTVFRANDGGYIVVGYTRSFGSGGEDCFLLKVDESGTLQWRKTYGGSGTETARGIARAGDGYVISGKTTSFSSSVYQDAWLVRVDNDGNEVWSKTYGGSQSDYNGDITAAPDGGFVFCGRTESFDGGDNDAWLVKVDGSGNVQWERVFGGDRLDKATAVIQTSDGGFVVAGTTTSFSSENEDGWLIKLDSSGTTEWRQTYGGANDDRAKAVVETTDGNFLFTGFTESTESEERDLWLVKVDQSGEVIWQQTHSQGTTDMGHSLAETGQGEYVVTGMTRPENQSVDAWALKLQDGTESGTTTPAPTASLARQEKTITGNRTEDSGQAEGGIPVLNTFRDSGTTLGLGLLGLLGGAGGYVAYRRATNSGQSQTETDDD